MMGGGLLGISITQFAESEKATMALGGAFDLLAQVAVWPCRA